MARVVNVITGNADRSTTPELIDIATDLAQRPLGRVASDPVPGVAFNARPSNAVYYMRNMSCVLKRKFVADTIGTQQITEKDKARYGLDGEVIRDRVNRGLARFEDVVDEVNPTHWVGRFDSQEYLIPAAADENGVAKAGEPGPWKVVPEGLIDIHLGNADRLAGYDGDPEHKRKPDAQIAKAEHARVNQSCGGRPIFFWEGDDPGPWAFIEVRKELMETVAVAIDAKHIRAGMQIQR